MKTRILPLFLIAFVAGIFGTYSLSKEKSSVYVPREKSEYAKKRDISGAMEWRNKRQANFVTGEIDPKDVIKAQQQARALRMNKNTSSIVPEWIEMGPDNVGGRTRAILIDKDDHDLLFAAGVSGGIWKSTNAGQSWNKITDESDSWDNLNFVSICQAANGDIYAGTGEGMYHPTGVGSGGFYGQGIWKSEDLGVTWTQLASTWTTDDEKDIFIEVNKLAADPTNENRIYAATKKGLRVTDDGGATWVCPFAFTYQNMRSSDVKVASDGTVITAVGVSCFLAQANSDADSLSFVLKSKSSGYQAAELINSSGVGRIEFAFSPDDPNYVYCAAAKSDGTMDHVYRSTDKGQKWSVIATGGDYFQPYRNQGEYDNVIAVFPGNKNKVVLGGIDLWVWENGGSFEQTTLWSLSPYHPNYVHADIHTIVFHPDYANHSTFYVGCDGGISKTDDGGTSFYTANRNYNVTQFYAIAFSPTGEVVGGTQDNGTQYISREGNTDQAAVEVSGGDGGYCEVSTLNPDISFGSVYYTDVRIGFAKGEYMSSYYYGGGGNFVTPLKLWESFNDVYSTDSVEYILPKELPDSITNPTHEDSVYIELGDTLHLKSSINELPIFHITDKEYLYGDTVRVQDTYQAAIAIGFDNSVIFARDPLSQASPTTHFIGTNMLGTVETLEFSKDGNYLYVATDYGYLYRIDSVLYARAEIDSALAEADLIASFSQIITGIAVDPENPDRVVISLGNYGETEYVYYSEDATSATPTFVSKQGNLPEAPAYSVLIDWDLENFVMLGTETGVYYTEDITATTPVWIAAEGFPTVPTYMLRQQINPNSWKTGVYNHGFIYAGTHGRGIFRTETLKGPTAVKEIKDIASKAADKFINVFPNPVVDIANVTLTIKENTNVQIAVYNLQGKLVAKQVYDNQLKGKRNYSFDVASLNNGTYIVKVLVGTEVKTSKFLKY
ncbi:MAG TPA: hypothetical protein DDX39_03460 [Bacteroidales bacterium]|nr:MAG: hypothetical protein A2W98_12860 [Bacteroidetes bacterium GWF2_33_38]OFY71423.1 MAG: hypothetical protein A2265_08400 [Bacteroidetes bacterium RIFOXYA12_FULL_33_9]OFY86067.1 MAG: hypothetical protein A2236_00485 [Bacteroidetes bacterium RIFOXYA2_FULL_33_7]HBF87677.1 hypothetical protein [Bacteroidales bacterium]